MEKGVRVLTEVYDRMALMEDLNRETTTKYMRAGGIIRLAQRLLRKKKGMKKESDRCGREEGRITQIIANQRIYK